jgi:hypothetical protein
MKSRVEPGIVKTSEKHVAVEKRMVNEGKPVIFME